MLVILVIREGAETDSTFCKRLYKVQGRFLSTAIAHMNAVLLRGCRECPFQQGATEPAFGLTFADHRKKGKKGLWVPVLVFSDLRSVKRTDRPGMIDVPEARIPRGV